METTISEIRSIVQRRRELEIEDQRLNQRFLELLELNQGARKSSRDTLSPKAGKAFFSVAKRGDGRWTVKFKDEEGRWRQRSFRTDEERPAVRCGLPV